jgi:hypothetical protein
VQIVRFSTPAGWRAPADAPEADGFAVMKRKAAPEDESLEFHVQKYLKQKEAEAKQVTIGRCYALKLHLTHFQDWLGKDTSVKEIDGEVLINFRTYVLGKAATKGFFWPTRHRA